MYRGYIGIMEKKMETTTVVRKTWHVLAQISEWRRTAGRAQEGQQNQSQQNKM